MCVCSGCPSCRPTNSVKALKATRVKLSCPANAVCWCWCRGGGGATVDLHPVRQRQVEPAVGSCGSELLQGGEGSFHRRNQVTVRYHYTHTHTHTRTHTHLMSLFPGLPGWAGNRKVKPMWILLKQETVSGSGISWDICQYNYNIICISYLIITCLQCFHTVDRVAGRASGL